MKRVEGHTHLYRNEVGAIINKDEHAYSAYVKKRDSLRRKDENISTLSEQLNEAKQEIEKLKELVKLALADKYTK